jgi:hypothetical protein
MPRLKDYFESDLVTMHNTDEFAETHAIDGQEINIVMDEDLVKERQAKGLTDPEGYYTGSIAFHAIKVEYDALFDGKPEPEQIMELDGDIYRVVDCQEDMGEYIITLGANRS